VFFKLRREYINGKNLATVMKTKFTMLIAIIMVLSGCTGGVEDAAEEIADVLTKGCMDKTAVNYDATAGETGNCVSKSVMTTNLIDFLNIVEDPFTDLEAKFDANENLAGTLTIDETFENETVGMVGSFKIDGVNNGTSTMSTITDSKGTWTMGMTHVGEDLIMTWNDTSVRMKTVTTPLEYYLMDESNEDGDDEDGDDDSGDDDSGDDEDGDDEDGDDNGGGDGLFSTPDGPNNPMDNMEANNTTWSDMDGMTISGTDSMGGVISATLDASGAITSMSYSISEADTSGSDTTALNTASASMTLLSDTTITIDQSIELHSLPLLALSMAEMMGMMGGGSGPDDGPLPDGGPDDGGPDNGGPMWMAFNYCQWEAEGNERWDCTDNANGEDGFDDWWYYCEMHEDAAGVIIYHCTDDFGQNSEFESSASNDHYVTGGSPGGPNDGGTNAGHPAPEWWCSDEVGGMVNMSINWTNVNDGTEDCGDGSDEPHDFDGDGTIDNWWHCHDGTNITVDKINDGTNDCLFGSDEGLNDRPELIFIEDMYTEPFNDMSAGYNLTITFTNLSEGENYTYVYEVYHMNNNKTSNVVSELIMGDSNGIASRELTISTSEWGESVWIESCYHLHVELTNETGIPIGSHAGHEIAIGAAECSGNPGDGSGNGGQNGNGNGGGNDGGAGMMGEGTYAIMGMDGIEGTLADYEAVLSQCTVGTLSERVCVDTNISMVLSTAPSPDSPIIFMDNDNSGTINSEDMIIVNDSLVTEEYNSVRLKYIPADKYSDENPLVLPGFTAGFSLMAMLGAALLLRRD
jgi:hypothetical protein